MSFQPDQTQLTVGVYLLQDSDPEDTETFRVKLVNPRHGAEIGSQDQVLVTIPSNDDGHGIIQFAEVSQHTSPSKHKTFTQGWFNVGPTSQTVAQH